MWWSPQAFTMVDMTTTHASSVRSSGPTETASWNRWRYWVPTGLLCLIFVVSAALSLLDPETTRQTTTDLGFPAFIGTYPLAFAKLAAVVVILWRRWPTLRLFAFAGLLYDMVLALMAHVHEDDFPAGWLAVFGLVVWCAAFWVERDRSARESAVNTAR
jgi:hypothetical protein